MLFGGPWAEETLAGDGTATDDRTDPVDDPHPDPSPPPPSRETASPAEETGESGADDLGPSRASKLAGEALVWGDPVAVVVVVGVPPRDDITGWSGVVEMLVVVFIVIVVVHRLKAAAIGNGAGTKKGRRIEEETSVSLFVHASSSPPTAPPTPQALLSRTKAGRT